MDSRGVEMRGGGQKHYTFTNRYQHSAQAAHSISPPTTRPPLTSARRAVDHSVRNLSFLSNGPTSPPPPAGGEGGPNSAGKRRRRDMSSPNVDSSRLMAIPPSIFVAVRLRALVQKESEMGCEYAWTMDKAQNTISEVGTNPKQYSFDYVCPPGESTTQLYKHCVRKTVLKACYGNHSNVFVYGPTNSGKSFTAMGTNHAPGLVLLAIGDVFHVIQKTPHRQFLLRVSCCEIYENSLDDLLGTGTNLKLESTKPDPHGVRVKDLTREFVRSATEFIAVLIRAAERRKKLAETAPDRTQRGHAIFRINIESRPRKPKPDETIPSPPPTPEESSIKSSVLTIADLGGSESFPEVNLGEDPDDTLTNAHELLCAINNNDPGKSKLARLLRSGLSNASHVALICTVSPLQEHIPLSSQCISVGLLAKAANKSTGKRLQTTKRNLGVVKKYQRIVDAIKVAVDKTRLEEQTKIRELQAQLEQAKIREQMMQGEKPAPGDENSREYLELKLRIMEGQIRLWEEKLGPYLEENRVGGNHDRGAEIQVRQLQEIVEKLRDQNKDLEDTKRRDRDKQEREKKEQERLEMLLEEKRKSNQEHAAELAILKDTLIRERSAAMSGVIMAIKCYGRGQRHAIKLRLRPDDHTLIWTSGPLSKERCLKLSDVTSLNLGQSAPSFANAPETLRDDAHLQRSFSLVTPSRSLNLIMHTQIAFEIWVEGLKSMLPNVNVQDFRSVPARPAKSR